MFSLFKIKKQPRYDIGAVYEKLITQVRQPHFYQELGAPDTFEGRFDLLMLHIFLLLEPLQRARQKGVQTEEIDHFSQKLFDIVFKNLDQSLRQMGVGDVGVPKHMKRMMLAFNGRMHAYQNAMKGDQKKLKETVAKNIYANAVKPDARPVIDMTSYMQGQLTHLLTYSVNEIMDNDFEFEQKVAKAA